jgi:putative membrane protein
VVLEFLDEHEVVNIAKQMTWVFLELGWSPKSSWVDSELRLIVGSSQADHRKEIGMRLLLNWVLSAVAVWIVAQVVPGVHVSGAVAALIAALAIGFINATIGALLKIITFPLTLVTLGLFWFVINALMLELASAVVPGFQVRGFFAAFFGAIVLSLVNLLLNPPPPPPKEHR